MQVGESTRTIVQAVRVQVRSDRPFDEVVARISKLVGDTSAPELVSLAQEVADAAAYDRIVSERFVGGSGFMSFAEIDHGAWIGLYGIRRKVVRWIIGNPLIAITMIKRDVTAGLFVPVELLLVDRPDDGGCDLTYMQPSSLIAYDAGDKALREAATALDAKFDALVTNAALG